MSEASVCILVTGAAGYLASWIVDQALREGYAVHGTVRQLDDRAKVAHLLEMSARHPGRLTLFEADLGSEGSFDAAMAGCALVIHPASPYFVETPRNAQRQLVEPALGGTLNVLAAANRCESVRRVVVTSSVVALYSDACDVGADREHTVREDDLNTDTRIEHNPYAYSKTVALKAAWEAQRRQTRWDLITIHPGTIFGPSLSSRVDATSVSLMINFLKGSFKRGVPRMWMGIVDVRDVALAHVRAATRPAAHGRYIVSGPSLRLLEMAQLMRLEKYGYEDQLPTREAPKALMWLIGPMVGMRRHYVMRNVGYPVYFDGERCRSELGITYRPVAETLNDHIQQVMDAGLLDT